MGFILCAAPMGGAATDSAARDTKNKRTITATSHSEIIKSRRVRPWVFHDADIPGPEEAPRLPIELIRCAGARPAPLALVAWRKRVFGPKPWRQSTFQRAPPGAHRHASDARPTVENTHAMNRFNALVRTSVITRHHGNGVCARVLPHLVDDGRGEVIKRLNFKPFPDNHRIAKARRPWLSLGGASPRRDRQGG